MKKVLNNIKKFIIKYSKIIYKFIKNNIRYIYMGLPFIIMDLFTRSFGYKINFYSLYKLVPNLFTLIWIVLFIGVVVNLKKNIGQWIYLGINIVFSILFLVNNVYYSMTNTFFSFNLVQSTSEGSAYFMDALVNCNKLVYLFFIIIIALIYLGFKNVPNVKKNNEKNIIKIFTVFIIIHLFIPILLGKANSDLVWSTWKNPRNVYNSFNDTNKSMRVSGFFEFSIRNFYITYLKTQKKDKSDLDFLSEVYSEDINNETNDYSGDFKDENLIILQLEGVDSWMLTKKDTPTLYNMMKNSINYTKHYSFYNGGGSTFGSEFAVNTGFTVPLSYNQNAYTFSDNDFPYSLPNMFKNNEYSVNAFHMNYGEYYSRRINYENWGYDNYYGLLDMYSYADESYTLDRELILNEEYSSLMFPTDQKFVDYIITYSAHLPFSSTKGVCKLLLNLEKKDNEELQALSEEECARKQAGETDYMVSLLLDKLKEKDLLKNTVIVVFTDHYLYTLEDQAILEKYKETDNNLINKTPFFIYNNGKTKKEIKQVTSQLNILPTILNLFGINYNSNYYIMSDSLNKNYEGIVFFSDYSWYDGSIYVEDGVIKKGKEISQDKLDIKNDYINYLARKNDLTLKYNYFKTIKNN